MLRGCLLTGLEAVKQSYRPLSMWRLLLIGEGRASGCLMPPCYRSAHKCHLLRKV